MTISSELSTEDVTGPGPIIMYGADWCGDCRRAKAYFAEHGVDYHYVDLEADPDEVDRVLERNGGVKKIPVIVFGDDSHLVEPSNPELAAKLAELSGRSPEVGTVHGRVVVDNTELRRFELWVSAEPDAEVLSFATYNIDDANVIVPHVETRREHRGNGYAAELMTGVIQNLRATKRSIVPLCPYAAGHLRDRPETHDVLARR